MLTATNRSLHAAALALLLAACSGGTDSKAGGEAPVGNTPANTAQAAPPAAKPAAATARPPVVGEGGGLRLFDARSGSVRSLMFGLAREPVMAALAFRGAPRIDHLTDCGAGPLDTASWPDGLTVYFQDRKFTGWAASPPAGSAGPAIASAAGVGPGSTRAQLDDAYEPQIFESTLGTEFTASGLFGVLDGTRPTSRITAMWAGDSCNMR